MKGIPAMTKKFKTAISIATFMLVLCVVASMPSAKADTYDPNDDFGSASSISTGTYSGLDLVSSYDEYDYFYISVPAGETISVRITFTDTLGDIDLTLYDSGYSTVDSSSSTGNSETVTGTNNGGSSETYYIRVDLYSGSANTYDMEIIWGTFSGSTVPGYDVFIVIGMIGLVGTILAAKYLRKRK